MFNLRLSHGQRRRLVVILAREQRVVRFLLRAVVRMVMLSFEWRCLHVKVV